MKPNHGTLRLLNYDDDDDDDDDDDKDTDTYVRRRNCYSFDSQLEKHTHTHTQPRNMRRLQNAIYFLHTSVTIVASVICWFRLLS